MRIVFMGTPDFAACALEALIAAGHEVCCAVTQPDKPKGRGREMQMSAVKECALRHGIPVFQPVRIRLPESAETLRGYGAELFVVAAFGQILSPEILCMPKYGCINIHASLLPKYRGAAPIQWAVLNGETETGVTIMQMDEGLDTGAMLARRAVPILDTDTGDSLHDKLMEVGAALVTEVIPLIAAGRITPKRQNEAESCYAKRLSKAQGKIDWTEDAAVLARLVRGLNSWPGAYTAFRGRNLKIWETDAGQPDEEGAQSGEKREPGCIIGVTKDTIEVQTGKGILTLKSVQPEGKRRMSVREFLLGYPVTPGERFGEQPSGANRREGR